MPRTVALVLAALLCCSPLAGCERGTGTAGQRAGEGAEEGTGQEAGPPSGSSVPTLSPLPPPPREPPSGELRADLRQSSRDAALGRMEVWIANETRRDLDPRRIRYRDPRFRGPLVGERLRTDPAGSERGYPLSLPARPSCDRRHGRGRLDVTHDGRTARLAVSDEADVVARYVAARCLELAVGRVARLRFADRVTVDHAGPGSTATLTLVVRPRGLPGRVLRIDSVGGTPLLTSADGAAWHPRLRVHGAGPVQRIRLPVRPARCDDHVFMESGGATAFLVGVHLDGRAGRLLLRMSPQGASAAIAFARDSCGL